MPEDSKQIVIKPVPQLRELLLQLKALGIYGTTLPQIVKTLVGLQIERLIREGLLTKPSARMTDLLDEDEDA